MLFQIKHLQLFQTLEHGILLSGNMRTKIKTIMLLKHGKSFNDPVNYSTKSLLSKFDSKNN